MRMSRRNLLLASGAATSSLVVAKTSAALFMSALCA